MPNESSSPASRRGIQQEDVWRAADELLVEGVRPTIEKIRIRLGRGSPNTVSPMLDLWFSSLGERMVGRGMDAPDIAGMPDAVRRVAKDFWDLTLREAQALQQASTQTRARDADALRQTLDAQANQLAAREASFAATRSQLDTALANSQQAVASMREQVNAAMARMVAAEQETAKLRDQLDSARGGEQRLKDAHGAIFMAKEKTASEAEARHVANERQLLGDLDRERQATRTVQAELAKEQKTRAKSEEALSTLNGTLLVAQRTMNQLQVEFASKPAELTRHAQDHAKTVAEAENAQEAVEQERRAHQQTRDMLANALAERVTLPGKDKRRRSPTAKDAPIPPG